MDPFGLRANGSSDRVTMFEKGFHDVDGHESVCAGDENFTSRSDGGHFSTMVVGEREIWNWTHRGALAYITTGEQNHDCGDATPTLFVAE